MVQVKSFILLGLASVVCSTSLRGGDGDTDRQLQSSSAYFSTSDPAVLGAADPDAAIGNPMKGLMSSPSWTGGTPPPGMPSSLEFHYVGMDRVMTGDNTFDWAVLDKTIQDAASRNNHVIWRVYVHYPGRTLALPRYLIDAGVKLVQTKEAGLSPQYEDPKLLVALEQLIKAMGARYDGHKSIAFIQLGLLGYWGEWHTYPDKGILADSTQDTVVEWYKNAFKTTKLQARGLTKKSVESGIGLHDDSFAYSSLSSTIGWFFWPQVVAAGQTNFWKTTVMGGETRPELQDTIFEPTYVPGDKYKQDFMQCVETTHATYMLNSRAFGDGGYQGEELNRARRAHARMGYNFQVSNVAVLRGATSSTVAVDVTVKQIGVAPFYYQLNLALTCPGTTETLSGVETLIESGSTKVFTFASIPADSTCLSAIRLALQSPMMYSGKPIKFAQGNGSVVLSLPLPNGSTPVVPKPVAAPVKAPTSAPARASTPAPVVRPTGAPAKAPTNAPVMAPTNAPIKATTNAPVKAPTDAPVLPVAPAPVPTPVAMPVSIPVAVPAPPSTIFIESTRKTSDRFVIAGQSTSLSRTRSRIAEVAGYKGEHFRSHRWARGSFLYTVAGFVPGAPHTITMGFAETYSNNCGIGKRIFNVLLNDAQVASNLDVFAAAGCRKGFTTTYSVTADENGEIAVKFTPVRENPFVSFIHIVEN